MKKIKLFDALLLFCSFAFFAMFVDQVLYEKNPLADSYFFLMFGLAGIFYFLYRRSVKKG